MISIQSPQEDFDPDLRLDECRNAMDHVLRSLVDEAKVKGWEPAEIVMSLVDAAEDYIVLLASGLASRH
jgi:hypothetical protein